MYARSALFAVLLLMSSTAFAWQEDRLVVPLMVNNHVIPYSEFAIYVLPGSAITFGFIDATGGATATLDGVALANDAKQITAPEESGLSRLEITNAATGETGRINVFTMVPAERVGRNGRLNGYRMGSYPKEPLRGLDIYLPPLGFVEVTEENRNTRVSPNFTLGQFVSKQASSYPKYVVLRASLLLKLENILASLNRAGHETSGFVIMSGYRTPFYNRAIGNVPYSRHVYGGAADIYIDDDPADGRMDDLNGDGRVDKRDAQWFANFINGMSRGGAFGPRIGGLGVYGSTSAHGPFVHVDVRGTRARW